MDNVTKTLAALVPIIITLAIGCAVALHVKHAGTEIDLTTSTQENPDAAR